jgi:hypothetical protein
MSFTKDTIKEFGFLLENILCALQSSVRNLKKEIWMTFEEKDII